MSLTQSVPVSLSTVQTPSSTRKETSINIVSIYSIRTNECVKLRKCNAISQLFVPDRNKRCNPDVFLTREI